MVYTTETKKCDVFITTNRNRVKTYGMQVYLKDGQKFEIELFNPYTYKVLAKVKMNGHYISDAGLVINPGQRIYLERYLDSNNAFIFSTYEIDGTTEALRAISENGNLEVEFYSEYIPSGWNYAQLILTNYPYNQKVHCRDTTINICDDLYSELTNWSSTTGFSLYSAELNETTKGSLETGRVEKGEKTKQEFGLSNDSFNSWAFETVKLKILPASAKPIEAKEIRNYCTECGTRMKKSTWKFCPNCGAKI